MLYPVDAASFSNLPLAFSLIAEYPVPVSFAERISNPLSLRKYLFMSSNVTSSGLVFLASGATISCKSAFAGILSPVVFGIIDFPNFFNASFLALVKIVSVKISSQFLFLSSVTRLVKNFSFEIPALVIAGPNSNIFLFCNISSIACLIFILVFPLFAA